MKTLKTLLIVGALVFATSAANAQSSFGLTKHEMGTHHLEAKYLEDGKTVTENKNQDSDFQNQNALRSNQGVNGYGTSVNNSLGEESYMNDWTSLLIELLF